MEIIDMGIIFLGNDEEDDPEDPWPWPPFPTPDCVSGWINWYSY